MEIITTTMSFRAAHQFGCPHLAGQPVTLTKAKGANTWTVTHRLAGNVAEVYYPRTVRQRGGVFRRAFAYYPGSSHKPKRW